ncbi:MAG: sarcosine oxidase subunit gamma family protein [Dongiaceae bacterium]
MAEPYLRRSALAHHGLPARAAEDAPRRAGAGLLLAERPHRCQVDLRGRAGEPGFVERVHGAIGLNLPLLPNTTTSDDGITALWLGPDEWLLVARPGREDEIAGKLRDALAGQLAAVTDVSEARTVIAISGREARTLLAKATGIDLHPRAFRAGLCAQTGAARANVILHQTRDDGPDGPEYELYVAGSFADYLWRWLTAAAQDLDPVVTEG